MWFRNHKPLGSRKCLCAKTFCWGVEFSWCNKNCPYVRTIGRSCALNCVSDHTKSLKVGDFLGDRTILLAAQNSRKGGIASWGYCQCALTLFTLARGFSTRTEFQVGLLRPRNNFRTCEKLQRSGPTAGCHLLPPQGSGRAIREAIVVVSRHSGNR